MAVAGELVWAETQGFADLETMTPATINTTYAIGSVAKPITAALTMKLQESGAVDLDQDVHESLPDFPPKAYPFNLRQLLSHQAGIRHYKGAFIPPTFSEAGLNRPFATISDSLALFADDPLLFKPDTGFQYSTFGYTLVSAVIESQTGHGFLDQLDRLVFIPLNMTRSRADDPDDPGSERATDYMTLFSSEAVFEAPEVDRSYKWAGGGLLSTPSDLARFGSALLRDGFLASSTRDMMFTSRSLDSGELNPQHYGLGWRIGGLSIDSEVSGEDEIIPLFHHGGSSAGAASILLLVPDRGLVVVMCINSIGVDGSGPLTSQAARIAREFIYFLRSKK